MLLSPLELGVNAQKLLKEITEKLIKYEQLRLCTNESSSPLWWGSHCCNPHCGWLPML